MEELTQKELKAMLHYNSLSGVFIWKERPLEMFFHSHCKWPTRAMRTWNTKYANKKAGVEWKSGNNRSFFINIRITIKGKQKKYLAHRLAFLYMT